jgi:hypothetical protein
VKQELPKVYGRILTTDQQADGSFQTASVPQDKGFTADGSTYKTTFASALILSALAEVSDSSVAPVRERLADFLLAQRGPEWSFNYWARDEPEAASRPYPEDWDDTSCSVIALTRARPEAVTGEALGHLIKLLTHTETEEGGPYRTWIVPASAHAHWHDVDIAVNANIAYMLQLHDVELPNLVHLMDTAITEQRLSSPYYPTLYPIWYFLSRSYQGQHRARLLADIMAQQQAGRWGSPLHTALAVSASLHLGAEPATVRPAVTWLRSLKEPAIRPETFCFDPAVEGRPFVAGARAVTAAFCLEALAMYDARAQVLVASGTQSRASQDQAEQIHAAVVARVMERFDPSHKAIRQTAERIRDRLLNGTAAGQITVLPYLFRQALGKNGRHIQDEQLVSLGVISLYGWMAYTIYDDFLDDEGDPPFLPIANIALRELVLAIQQQATARPGFSGIAWPILDRQEAANAWEVTHCRVKRQSQLIQVEPPQYNDLHVLAERSMGHALGCVALAMEAGYETKDPQVQALLAFFYHFLIARQLSDDTQDWKADLQKGQINAVGAHLLVGVHQRPSSVRALYGKLEQLFWERTIEDINKRIFQEISQARAALQSATFVQQPKVLEALLNPIEEAARQAHRQQQQMIEFLRTYSAE